MGMNKKIIPIAVVVAVLAAAVVVYYFTRERAVAPGVNGDTGAGESTLETDTGSVPDQQIGIEVGQEVVNDGTATSGAAAENVTPEAVDQELKGIDLGEIEAELQGIDSDLDQL